MTAVVGGTAVARYVQKIVVFNLENVQDKM